jgi:catechol 2,3-dioxygenase-like lactoylglutathione lyase family enzyme
MFSIQKLFHLTQVVDNLDQADRWYNQIFSPCRFYRGYMKEAVRHASLLAIGDETVIEPLQVADEPGASESPLGRFRSRYGSRLHSVAWYVDDLENTVDALRSHGVRLVDVSGRAVESREQSLQLKYVWTHPKDSFGALEFARLDPAFTVDPRVQPFWSASYWKDIHPLGIHGPLRITMATKRLDAAAAFYRDVLGSRETVPLMGQAGRSFEVGSDSIIDLVDATQPRFGDFGEGLLGMSFQVKDLQAARRHLQSLGLPTESASAQSIWIPPAHALGTTVGFHQVPGGL